MIPPHSVTRWLDYLFYNWPFSTLIICPIWIIICQSNLQILPNIKSTHSKWPKFFNVVLEMRNFAKSGHTDATIDNNLNSYFGLIFIPTSSRSRWATQSAISRSRDPDLQEVSTRLLDDLRDVTFTIKLFNRDCWHHILCWNFDTWFVTILNNELPMTGGQSWKG